MKEERAQVPVEFLLIAAGVIAVTSIVALFIKSSANTVAGTAQEAANKP